MTEIMLDITHFMRYINIYGAFEVDSSLGNSHTLNKPDAIGNDKYICSIIILSK